MSTKDDVARLAPRNQPEKRLASTRAPRAIRAQTGLERRIAGNIRADTITAQSTDGLLTFVVAVVKA